jgi:hypothetical protein
MKRLLLALAFVMLPALPATAGDPLTAEMDALYRMAKVVRLDEAVLRWREIPWYADINEGLKVANEEKRPVFLFVSVDDPLCRC